MSSRRHIDGCLCPYCNPKPTVAACIPHRDYMAYLPETLESLNQQTYRLSHIVVMDDNSKPEAWAQLVALWETWEGVPLTIRRLTANPMQERSQRIPYVRNQAFLALPGPTPDYIFFPDADDLWAPEYVKDCLDIMENDDSISIVYPNICLLVDGKPGKLQAVPNFNQERLFRQCYITCCSLMRTEAFLKAGMWPTKWFKKEYVFWNIITRIGHKAQKLEGKKFFYRQHPGQRHTQYNGEPGSGRLNKMHRNMAREFIARRFGFAYQ